LQLVLQAGHRDAEKYGVPVDRCVTSVSEGYEIATEIQLEWFGYVDHRCVGT